MKRIHLLLPVIPAVLCMAIFGAVLAQNEPYDTPAQQAPAPATSTLSGTVVSSTGNTLVIRTDDGIETTFVVDASSILPASMAPGDRVRVEYHLVREGGYHASYVTMAGGGAAAAPTSPAAAAVGQGYEDTTGSDEDLPRTASPLPLLALIGVLSIATATGLRALASRRRPRF